MKRESFEDLEKNVKTSHLCLFCGACVAVCPVQCLRFGADGPEMAGDCIACGQCMEVCPGLGVPLYKLDAVVFGRTRTGEEDLSGFGIRISDQNLLSADPDIRICGYTGGKVTALLSYLLDTKEIDAVVTSCWGRHSSFPWFSWPAIATTRAEVMKCAGSKYVFSPNLMGLRETAARKDLKAVALVGLPCHIQGLRKLQFLGEPYAHLTSKIKYAFGLYCGSPMVARQDFIAYISKLFAVAPQQVAKVDFHRVSEEFDVVFKLVLKTGSETEKRMNIMELFQVLEPYPRWHRCTLCTDYSAEHADISFGGIHVTPRTATGDAVLKIALANGCLVKDTPNPDFHAMTMQLDQHVTQMKKIANRESIAELQKQGKPVPRYDDGK